MDTYWAWAFLLLIFGLGLAVLEVFFPSGGLIGLLCLVALGMSITFGFMHSITAGLTILFIGLIGLPSVIMLAFYWLPKTRFGGHLILDTPKSDEVLPDTERHQKLSALLGKRGKARSRMMPSGAVSINGKTYDAVAEGVALDAGDWIEVVEFQGNRLVVRALTEEEVKEAKIANNTGDEESSLAQPIDEIADDPFEE